MHQFKNMLGQPLEAPVEIPEVLCKILTGLPATVDGILGVDLTTGLVLVQTCKRKQQYMKFGKYLRKSGLSDEVVRDKSNELKCSIQMYKGVELKFTASSEEAEEVYARGPNSCMAGMSCVQAYYSENISVAFVEVEEEILGRAVVCTDPDLGLRYSRIYGNEELLRPLLEKAGYVEGNLQGCHLARIEEYGGRVYCPYLDCGSGVDDCGSYLLISEYGEHSATNTGGYLSTPCEECQELCSEDELMFCDYEGQYMCSCCWDSCHVLVDGSSYHEDSDEIVQTGDGDFIVSGSARHSEHEGEWFHEDDVTYSDYADDYYKNSEVVTAIVGVEDLRTSECHRDDCELASTGLWVHDDFIEDYELAHGSQLEMEYE